MLLKIIIGNNKTVMLFRIWKLPFWKIYYFSWKIQVKITCHKHLSRYILYFVLQQFVFIPSWFPNISCFHSILFDFQILLTFSFHHIWFSNLAFSLHHLIFHSSLSGFQISLNPSFHLSNLTYLFVFFKISLIREIWNRMEGKINAICKSISILREVQNFIRIFSLSESWYVCIHVCKTLLDSCVLNDYFVTSSKYMHANIICS